MAATPVDYARVAFDLIDEFDRMTTADQVMARLSAAFSSFGYTAFLITGVPEPPQRVEPYFLLNGWPDGWTAQYAKENYYLDDPVAAWCRRTINPFEWSEAPYDAERCPRAAEVMNIASDFGMKEGFLVPIVRGNGFHACVTMAGERPDLEPRAKRAIHLVSIYAHEKAITLMGLDRGASPSDADRAGARDIAMDGDGKVVVGHIPDPRHQRTDGQLVHCQRHAQTRRGQPDAGRRQRHTNGRNPTIATVILVCPCHF